MEHKDKHLEELVEKLMLEGTLESPSQNFTDNVMDEVLSISKPKSLVYKPLIPKVVWAFIILGVLSIIVYVLYSQPTSGESWFGQLGLSELKLNPLEGISFKFSSVFMYAMLCMALMLGVQIGVLKRYLTNRVSY